MPGKKKRGYGEGSIRQRPDGRWEARISAGFHPDGKRNHPSIYADTYQELIDLKRKYEADMTRGFKPGTAPGKGTLGEFITFWLENVVKPSRSPVTYAGYETLMRVHVVPELGKVQLRDLTSQHVQHFLNQKYKAGQHSHRSIEAMRDVLRIALNRALQWGMVSRNAAQGVELPRGERKEMTPYTLEQARAFLEAIHGERQEALYIIVLSLGLRRGEVLGLKWEDLNQAAGTLRIRRTVQRLNRGLVIGETKTKGSAGTMLLPDIAINALRAHRARQNAEKRWAKDKWHDDGWIFATPLGTPTDPSNLEWNLRGILKRYKLAPITLHGLRHTIATLLLEEDVPDNVIADFLRHSSPAITRQIYLHVMERRRKRTAGKVDELLGGTA